MIQEIHSNFFNLKPEFEEIFSFLYSNPGLSFEENQSLNFLCDKLSKYGFKIEKDFLDVKNCFFAQLGSGHPKIGLIFDLDAAYEGHTKGNNLSSAIMCCVGIIMSQVKEKLNGSICLFGCSGEGFSGTKITLLKEGAFKNIDYMLSIMPYVKNFEDILSPSSTSYSIKFYNKTVDDILKNHLTQIIDFNKLVNKIDIYTVKLTNSLDHALMSIEFRSNEFLCLDEFGKELEQYLKSSFTNLDIETCYYDMPYCQVKNDETLKKIVVTNLKQSGIIDFDPCENFISPMSLGNISFEIPTYVPCIDVCENKEIKYDTNDFYLCTNSIYAKEQSYKAILALCLSIVNIMNIN